MATTSKLLCTSLLHVSCIYIDQLYLFYRSALYYANVATETCSKSEHAQYVLKWLPLQNV